ncbi:porin [Colwelliaceae bacterium 6471]
MKTAILGCAVLATLLAGIAQGKEYPQNPVLRPLTLTDGTIQIAGAYSYGKAHDDDTKAGFGANISYGITDDFQIGLEGLTYSFLKNRASGLELAVNAGIRGHYDNTNIGDSLGLGVSVFGKQVLNNDFALTFGAGYTHWDEEHIDNKYQFNYSLGALVNIADNVTLSANYTFTDLKDFKQDSSNTVRVGVNYAYSKSIDMGIAFKYSDFEETYNNFAFHEQAEKSASMYAAWRF